MSIALSTEQLKCYQHLRERAYHLLRYTLPIQGASAGSPQTAQIVTVVGRN